MSTATLANNAKNVPLLTSLYNIQYPNCRIGMFSLREPFKNMNIESLPINNTPITNGNLNAMDPQPSNLNINKTPNLDDPHVEALSMRPRKVSKRHAEVQCVLLKPSNGHDIGVQTKSPRQRITLRDRNDETIRRSPEYYHPRKLKPIETHQQVYEILDIESPHLRTIPIKQKINHREQHTKYIKTRKPIFDYDDGDTDHEEEEFVYTDNDNGDDSDDNNERIIYARQPSQIIRKTYLPSNVRMVCVRDVK